MKPIPVVVLLATLGCAGVAVVWWWGNSQRSAPQDAHADESGEGTRTDEGPSMATEARSEIASGESDMETKGVARTVQGTEYRSGSGIRVASPRVDPGISWPVTRAGRTGRTGSGSTAATGDPSVAAELAFRALQYVGVDPEAEKTWLRAINDPNTSAVDRGDLIEDLNEEGYLDNSRPTKEDLPLILAHLELIERVAPYAVDKVNADAFEEAYKDLLNMYVRLGGPKRV